MKTTSAELSRIAFARFQNLITGRDEPQNYEPHGLNLVDPPVSSLRPVASLGLGFVIVVALFTWANRPTPAPTSQIVSSGVALVSATPASDIVVDIEGDVNKPGLVHLPVGSRMADAIAAAQGMKPGVDGTTINLAARLDDGQLIIVGKAGQSTGEQDSRVSLNQGSESDFDSLPGVGPVLAGRIVAYREQHNHFSSIDQLQEVPGIGPKVFNNLKPLIKL